MRFIPTSIHGVIDYIVGLTLILSPFLLGFATGGPAQWVPIILGAVVIVQSVMTRYELGLFPVIPMKTHLTLDGLNGALLLVSPWLFGFAGLVFLPHVLIGLFEIGASLMTEKVVRHRITGTPGHVGR